MGKDNENDYSVMVNSFMGLFVAFVPVLGTVYNAVFAAHLDKRLEEVEKQLQMQGLDEEAVKKFLETDEGYSFFRALNESVLNAANPDRIAVFIRIMKDCCEGQVPLEPLEIQYKTAVMKIIASLTDYEMLMLTYYMKYFEEIPVEERESLPNSRLMEVSMEASEGDDEGMNFAEFLAKQPQGDILLRESEFFFLRLSSMGIAHDSNRLKRCYYITPLGKALIEYIKQ